jgi:hypothetical protein
MRLPFFPYWDSCRVDQNGNGNGGQMDVWSSDKNAEQHLVKVTYLRDFEDRFKVVFFHAISSCIKRTKTRNNSNRLN